MMILKGCGRKQPWPDFEVLFQYLPGGTEENHKNVSQQSWLPGRDLKPGPPKCEAGVLRTLPQRSVA
jgi:hypothetical protein